ncbi:MAG: HEAT repeat domain-containing protein [Planctomycetes bacterium]|nr:HEAT repeat domain-containing protein [Planctomycetota bacterium]
MRIASTVAIGLGLAGSVLAQGENGSAARNRVERELVALAAKTMRFGPGESPVAVEKTEEYERIRGVDGHLEALHEVADALFSDNQDLRVVALEVIATIGDKSSVYKVLLILNDSNEVPNVRVKAIEVAVRFGDPRAVIPLVEIIALPETEEKVGESGRTFYRWSDVKRRAADAIARFPGESVAIDRLVRYLTEEIATPSTVENAAYCLGLLKAESAVPDLRRLLRSTNLPPAVKREVLIALGRIGAEGALGEIASALHDPDSTVQMEAVNALGYLGPAAASEAGKLAGILSDESADLYVRASIPGALVKIAPDSKEVSEALVALLGKKVEGLPEWEDPNLLHVAAMAALQFAAPARAIPLLVGRLGDADENIVSTATGLLKRLAKSFFEEKNRPFPKSKEEWKTWWENDGQSYYRQ